MPSSVDATTAAAVTIASIAAAHHDTADNDMPPPTLHARDDMRCKYPYKACFHPRSIKKDGEAHSLCEFHRKKANSIQKIYATKRRQQLRALKKHKILQHKLTTPTAATTNLPCEHPPMTRAEMEMAQLQSMLAARHATALHHHQHHHPRLPHRHHMEDSEPQQPRMKQEPYTRPSSKDSPRLYDVSFLLNHG
ncbi:Aste57867_338 [Aphanomyces stellatus]|uniref:Aste57867_338 protein n=1 Tax=Aphanomyces stellatus TaxID=120398 RepID=A0A485K3D6_9STRA|nr:hypothetical protein As57867_000338 [Aphanomyces stellatus]VFT77564.1 Aste57867_338 [Aphanomyces stellatus]